MQWIKWLKSPLLICLVVSQLTACSLLSKQVVATPEVYLSPEQTWQLPSLEVLPDDFQVTQSVVATYGQKQFDLMFHVEKKAGRFAMAALTPNGQLLAQAVYENKQITGTVSPLVGKNLSLSYLVSDFFLVFGQSQILSEALQKSGVQLDSCEYERKIKTDSTTLITIKLSGKSSDQWPDQAEYKNKALGYALTIKTLSHKTL